MTTHYKLDNILFLDIETVSHYPAYAEVPSNLIKSWENKCQYFKESSTSEESLTSKAERMYTEKAAIYAEFGKIICISLGVLQKIDNHHYQLRLKSIYGADEKKLLQEFSLLLAEHYYNVNVHQICGHNIKEFDIPYICRRMVINGLSLPKPLQIQGKKPWECKHLLDTLQMWKFGDYKNYISLATLAQCLNIPISKYDISGKDVGRVYWEEKDEKRIALYCEADVICTAKVFLKIIQSKVQLSPDYISNFEHSFN